MDANLLYDIITLVLLLVIIALLNRVKVKKVLIVTLYFLLRFFPKKKNLIVFGGEAGRGFRGNPKYLFIEMNKRKDVECVWISKSKKVVEQIRKMGYPCLYAKSIRGIWVQLRARALIHSHSINEDFIRVLVGGAISINTWHGVGLKKVWAASKSTLTYKILHRPPSFLKKLALLYLKTTFAKENYVLSTSERVSSYYPETFCVDFDHVIELGQARNDVFFEDTVEDQEVPDWIKTNRIITYMPTHRKKGKSDKPLTKVINFEALNQLCNERNTYFLIKNHMYSKGKVPNKYDRIIDASKQAIDPQLLLKYTDVLVTDYSSCYTDFLLLNRPVVFYCYDLKSYLHSNEMYFDYEEVTPGPKVKTFDELLESLDQILQGYDHYADERKRVLNIFYSSENQQKVTTKQVDYIIDKIFR
jgi:CDP-glycerol glycerophosphotransferase (TagB/SpsB family)